MNLQRAVFAAVPLSGAALALGAFLFRANTAPSVAVGAGLAVGNLWALRGTVHVLATAATSGRAPPGSTIYLSLKLVALFGFVWLLLSRHLVGAGGLAVGYCALPLGVAIGAIVCEKR